MAAHEKPETSLTLLERVQRFPADREAWDEFVRRYHPMIHAWCKKWGLQSSDADDVAQDVVSKRSLEVYQHLSLENIEGAYQEAVQSIGL